MNIIYKIFFNKLNKNNSLRPKASIEVYLTDHLKFLIGHKKNNIKEILPPGISIIDTITPVNKHIKNVLILNESLNLHKNKGYMKIFYNGEKLSKKYISKEYELNFLEF